MEKAVIFFRSSKKTFHFHIKTLKKLTADEFQSRAATRPEIKAVGFSPYIFPPRKLLSIRLQACLRDERK